MTVKIRLRRMGAKKRPSYRVVVADSRAPRDGAVIETIGNYDPLTDPETVKIDTDKARHWLQHGAQPTEPVSRLLRKTGVIDGTGTTPRKGDAGEAPAAGSEE